MRDLIVVGSGGAGMAAATAAASRGLRVLVIDRSELIGGTTAVSGGGMWIPNNPVMGAMGFSDSEQDALVYLRRLTMGTVAEERLEGYLRDAPDAIRFLQRETDLEIEATDTPDYQTAIEGASSAGRQVAVGLFDSHRIGDLREKVRRGPSPGGIPPVRHAEMQETGWGIGENARDWIDLVRDRNKRGIYGRGRAMISGLLETALRFGAEVETNTRAIELVLDRGRVTGVVVERDGTRSTIHAKHGVVLASGGFEWNRSAWNGFVATPLIGPLSPPVNTGDGLRMAMQAGAGLANMKEAWWVPCMQMPGEMYEGAPRVRGAQADKGLPGAIAVNRRGRRFGNEAMNYNDFGKLLVQMDPHTYEFENYPAYVISDSAHLERYPLTDDPDASIAQGWLHSAPTLRELAERVGIDADGLEAQVLEFNRDAAQGRDTEYDRGRPGSWETYRDDPYLPNGSLGPVEKPPYYAYEIGPGCFGTKGGAVTDSKARVVGFDGSVIPGLFAAGNVAAGVFGPGYPGGGSTLGPAITLGYVAGMAAGGPDDV